MLLSHRSPRSHTRRTMMASMFAAWAGAAWRTGEPGSAVPALRAERERIGGVERTAGIDPPLMLGMARVVLRPRAASWAATPGGLRMIGVEAGVLGVSVGPAVALPITSAELATTSAEPEPREDLLVPAGTAMTFAPLGIISVRNPGARPVVVLDAVVYSAEPRPISRAFTTNDGVSFQLLASANAKRAPVGIIAVTLERVRLGARAALPADLRAGLTLIYLEAGGLDLEARAGEIHAARAAAAAPYAMPGSMQLIEREEMRSLTAGGAIFLALGAEAGVRNAGEREAVLLVLAVRESA